jgi:hypothetical protein
MAEWTRADVSHRFREAWDTLRRMPERCFPAPLTSTWPEVVRDWREAYGYTAERVKLARPSPQAIDRMHETIDWFTYIALQPSRKNIPADTHERTVRAQSRAVWLCSGCGMTPKRAGEFMGLQRDSVRHARDAGLDVVTRALNADPSRATLRIASL